MPKYYSHSKISAFEKCPLKFKFRYIDKIESEIKTIEAHLGSVVHSVLEWLYTEVKEKKKIPEVSEVISFYVENWRENYSPQIKIVKLDSRLEDYFSKGVEFLLEYYNKHHPFDDNTLEVEKKILINLDEEGEYILQGFIDRLSYNEKEGEYIIHDYKTSNVFPDEESIENDRQLALYSIAIKELFGDDKKICLTWHYLAHNKKVCSRRTSEQLKQLKQDVLNKIKEIESTEKFPPFISQLCDWCEYKNICPAWKKN